MAETLDLDAATRELTRTYLALALRATGGDRRAAAARLGIPHTRLYRLLAEHPDLAAEYPAATPGTWKRKGSRADTKK